MSRGLGTRQRAVLAVLRQLDSEQGPGWRSPAEVVAALGVVVRAPVVRFDPNERTDGPRLAHFRQLVRQGYREYHPAVRELEERIARREADRAEARRKASQRAPNLIRPAARGGEDGNPARVFALLERRGLVERRARCGPGSAVRLVIG